MPRTNTHSGKQASVTGQRKTNRRSSKSSRGRERRELRSGSDARPAANAAATLRVANASTRASKAKSRPAPDYELALTNFETGSRLFSKKQYEKAAVFFQKVLACSIHELSDRASVRLRFCERMAKHEPAPKTAEDFYLRGIAALNGRELAQAIEYLERSDKIGPRREHVQYALAAAHALQSNADAALVHLQNAIELRPGARLQARLDEDFQLLEGDPRFERLLGVRLTEINDN